MNHAINPFERIAAERQSLLSAWEAACDVPDEKISEAEDRAQELYGDRCSTLIHEAASTPAASAEELAAKLRMMLDLWGKSLVGDEAADPEGGHDTGFWLRNLIEDAERLAGGGS